MRLERGALRACLSVLWCLKDNVMRHHSTASQSRRQQAPLSSLLLGRLRMVCIRSWWRVLLVLRVSVPSFPLASYLWCPWLALRLPAVQCAASVLSFPVRLMWVAVCQSPSEFQRESHLVRWAYRQGRT